MHALRSQESVDNLQLNLQFASASTNSGGSAKLSRRSGLSLGTQRA
jgi:hypothetical protein